MLQLIKWGENMGKELERMDLTCGTLKSHGFKLKEEVEWGYVFERKDIVCEALINGNFEIKPSEEINVSMKDLEKVNEKIRRVKGFIFSKWRESGYFV